VSCRDLGNPSRRQRSVLARGDCRWSAHVDDRRGNHHDTASRGSHQIHDRDRLVHLPVHHGRRFHHHVEGCQQNGCRYSTGSSAFHDVHHIPTMKTGFIQHRWCYQTLNVVCNVVKLLTTLTYSNWNIICFIFPCAQLFFHTAVSLSNILHYCPFFTCSFKPSMT